jgi:putative phage-type endonuclease
MIVLDFEQGTPEWHAYRCGKVTASRVADVIAKTKTGWGASRANYAAQLVVERLTGTVAESYSNAEVGQCGLIQHPTIPLSCASPDGLIGDDGLLEIKCPNSATHIETLLSETVPGRYVTQIQWQLACSDRAWCDFVSFDPRLPGEMQLFVQRVRRDDAVIRELATQIEVFLSEVADTVSQLQCLEGGRMKTLIATLAIVVATPAVAQMDFRNGSNSPQIYAPDGQYLGNLNNNRYDPNSVANPYGQYGSRYSPNSINNPYSTYGNPYSPQYSRPRLGN